MLWIAGVWSEKISLASEEEMWKNAKKDKAWWIGSFFSFSLLPLGPPELTKLITNNLRLRRIEAVVRFLPRPSRLSFSLPLLTPLPTSFSLPLHSAT